MIKEPVKLVKWRATFNYYSQQMTIEFEAPVYNKNINYSHLARVEFVRMLRNHASELKVTNVEPVEQ